MKLELTTEQVNQVLSALAQQPYIQVHELIHTIRTQGEAQVQNGASLNGEVNNTHQEIEG